MTARYRLVEMIYLGRITETTKQLEQAVVQLYASMLLYLAKAKRYFDQNTFVRVVKSGLLAKSDLYELLDKMDLHEKEAERCATLVEVEMNKGTGDQMKQVSDLRDVLAKIDQPILQMSIKIERVEDHLDDLQRQKILDWLSLQRNGDHHKSIKDRVLTGTCGWIIQVPEFIKWQGDSTNSLLWLHGMQGVGKSCLTSVVIEDSMQLSQSDESCALAYFYCSRDTSQPQRADPPSILACLARQLSSTSTKHAIAPPTIALHESFHSTSGSREVPTIDEIIELILDLTNLYSRTTIVVDALDECDSVTRWKLIDALNNIVDNSDSLVKVFLSSREEGDLRLFIQDHTGVQVTGLQNGEDIRRFVEFETDRMVFKRQILSRIRKQSTKDGLKQHIKDDVVSKANGM